VRTVNRSRIVVDASVCVKWVVNEEYSEYAWRIRDEHLRGVVQAVMPSIGAAEVLNALRKYVSRGLLKADYAAEAVEILSSSGIELFQVDWGLAGEALELALERGLSVYDGIYVALAKRLGAELYTADQKLVEKAGVGFVKHVREYGT